MISWKRNSNFRSLTNQNIRICSLTVNSNTFKFSMPVMLVLNAVIVAFLILGGY